MNNLKTLLPADVNEELFISIYNNETNKILKIINVIIRIVTCFISGIFILTLTCNLTNTKIVLKYIWRNVMVETGRRMYEEKRKDKRKDWMDKYHSKGET